MGKQAKPLLNFWQIWNMSFGFLGIQFGFGLQNANTSRIFESLGADVETIPILWIAAPLTGLIVQPIVGYFSDRTWHAKLGRRRPYFLVGAILASIALCLMPNSPTLWVAAGMLWMMDASINITMEPFRAFVGDNLPAQQRTIGFATQSFFIGVGAVVASALPWMLTNWFDVSNVAAEGQKIADSVKWSFYIGAAVFLLAVLWTIIRSHEYSPAELQSFGETEDHQAPTHNWQGLGQAAEAAYQERFGLIVSISALVLMVVLRYADVPKEVSLLVVATAFVGVLWIISSRLIRRNKHENGFVSIMTDLLHMPLTMRQLAVVQFFSWFALFSMWIYTTSGVTAHIYGTTDSQSALYNEGADWVGLCFAAYNLVAALVAFALPYLAKLTNRRVSHLIALTLGGLGLISIYFITDPKLIMVSMVGVGIAWASILSLPYAMLAGSLPPEKMGYYMGVFNFFIVIPQLVAATILGFIVGKLFGGEAIYALIVGGVSMIIAGLLTLRVYDPDEAVQ